MKLPKVMMKQALRSIQKFALDKEFKEKSKYSHDLCNDSSMIITCNIVKEEVLQTKRQALLTSILK